MSLNSSAKNAAFSVVVSNTAAARYQWYFENSPLSSRTNATLTIVGVVTNSTGHYSVVITNFEGATTSRLALLTVAQPDFGPQAVSGLSSMTSYRGQNGLIVHVNVTGSSSGAVWGTGIYTDDSALQAAAVHAGYLTNGEMGALVVEILPGQSSYVGTTSHGVTSSSYGVWWAVIRSSVSVQASRAQPLSRVSWIGGTASFAVQAAATARLSSNGSIMAFQLVNETNTILTLSNLTSADAGTYAVTARTILGTNTSEIAALIVVDPTPGSPPVNAATYANNLSYLDGEVYRVIVTGSTNPNSLYGSGIYTLDSSLSLAAFTVACFHRVNKARLHCSCYPCSRNSPLHAQCGDFAFPKFFLSSIRFPCPHTYDHAAPVGSRRADGRLGELQCLRHQSHCTHPIPMAAQRQQSSWRNQCHALGEQR
jgi:hypothetical protein